MKEVETTQNFYILYIQENEAFLIYIARGNFDKMFQIHQLHVSSHI